MEINNPLISIVIPTHNRFNLFKRAFESILNQTYSRLEIIVVLDGCTDQTLNYIEQFSKNDSRVAYINNVHSKGGMAARIQGIHRASGAYIAFLDDDDIWDALKIETQLKYFNESISIVGCNYRRMRNGKILTNPIRFGEVRLDALKSHNLLGSFSFCMVQSKAVKSLNLKTNVPSCQDWYVWLNILIADTSKKAYICEEVLCSYDDGDHIRITNKKTSKIAGYQFLLNEFSSILNKKQKNNIQLESIIFNLKYLKNTRFERLKLLLSGIKRLNIHSKDSFNRAKMLLKYTLIQ